MFIYEKNITADLGMFVKEFFFFFFCHKFCGDLFLQKIFEFIKSFLNEKKNYYFFGE